MPLNELPHLCIYGGGAILFQVRGIDQGLEEEGY